MYQKPCCTYPVDLVIEISSEGYDGANDSAKGQVHRDVVVGGQELQDL